MSKSTTNVLLGFLAGASVGAVMGILFAPEKGDETRRKIKKSAEDFGSDFKSGLSEKMDTMSETFSDFVDEVKKRFSSLEEKVKKDAKVVKENTTN